MAVVNRESRFEVEEGTPWTPKKDPAPHANPWEVGQITERLPAWEVWEDGVEPEKDELAEDRERAA